MLLRSEAGCRGRSILARGSGGHACSDTNPAAGSAGSEYNWVCYWACAPLLRAVQWTLIGSPGGVGVPAEREHPEARPRCTHPQAPTDYHYPHLSANAGVRVSVCQGHIISASKDAMTHNHNTLDITTLESWLWEAACIIRGPVDAPKFKDYILPLIFLKRLSDVFDDEIARLGDEFGSRSRPPSWSSRTTSWSASIIPRAARWADHAPS